MNSTTVLNETRGCRGCPSMETRTSPRQMVSSLGGFSTNILPNAWSKPNPYLGPEKNTWNSVMFGIFVMGFMKKFKSAESSAST